MAKQDQFKGKTTLKEMAQNWAEGYGEDLANDYSGFYDELYEKYGNKPIPLTEIQDAWRYAYGEEIDENYTGFWGSIGGKIPLYDLDGTFETPDGEVVEMPDEEAHTIMDAAGENKSSVSEYMAKKNKDKFYNEAPYGEEDEEEMMANEGAYGEETAAQPKGMPKGAVNIMEKGSLDKAIKEQKPNQEVMKKVMGKDPVKKIEKITESKEPKIKGGK